jgi:hypothetical protein
MRKALVVWLALGLSAAGCGNGSDTARGQRESRADTRYVSDRARPEDPSVEEALIALRAKGTPGIPENDLEQVLEERASDPAYRPSSHQSVDQLEHEHTAGTDPYEGLSRAERRRLEDQIERAGRAARRYPTVADARAAGYLPVGPFSPDLGVHFANFKYQAQADLHWDWPGILMYQGLEPDDPVVGMLYMTREDIVPEGFVGTGDQWHGHLNVCIKRNGDAVDIIGVDGDLNDRTCGAAGGVYFGGSGSMLHVWPIDGLVPPGGPFAENNPLVGPAD